MTQLILFSLLTFLMLALSLDELSILIGGVDFSFLFDKLSNTCVPLV